MVGDPSVRFILCLLALVGGAIAPLITWAASLPSGIESGFGARSGIPAPEFSDPRSAPTPILPREPLVPENSLLSSGPTIYLRAVTFEGNHLFSDAQLTEVVGSDLGRTLSAEDLRAIRHRLTHFYVDHGYINSGVLLPDQEVVDGVVHFQVIEGRISKIQVSGNHRLPNRFIERGLLPDPTEVLNMHQLQDRVLLLHQDPLIDRLKVEVIPGLRRGEANLAAEVTEANPWHWRMEVNNYRSPDVGAEQMVLTVSHANLTRHADAFQLAYAGTRGLNDISADYDLPLGSRSTALTFGGEYINARVISPEFNALDIESESRRINIGLRYFLVRRPDSETKLGLKLEWADNRTLLWGEPFPFPNSGSEDNGKSSIAVLRFGQEWLSRSLEQVIAARSTFNFGLDAFGATIHNTNPDSRFFSWMGELQWARRFGKNRRYQYITRALARFSDDSLLPLERFSIAGPNTVRGYREGLLVRDEGWLFSLELRAPLFTTRSGRTLQVAPFIDTGQAWNKLEQHESLSSVGIGLLWQPNERLQANIYFGIPFGKVDHPTTTLQDRGLLFQIGYHF